MFQACSTGVQKPLQQHVRDVASIQERLVSLGAESLGNRSGRSVSHMTSSMPLRGSHAHPLDLLRGILEIDPVHQVAWVEPGVTMEELCACTLRHSLLPFVVPEFRAITVGGAIMGAALESSSFRYGQFSDQLVEAELLLADGTLLTTTPHEHSDLFYGISGSYGSLATLLSVKIRLRAATPHIQLSYEVVHGGVEAAVSRLKQAASARPIPDFLDAMVLNEHQTVLMQGRWDTDTSLSGSAPAADFRRPWAQWFCQHVLQKTKNSTRCEILSTMDYLFRYDRGAFWMGQFLTCWSAAWRFLLQAGISREDLPEVLHAAFRAHPPTMRPSLAFRILCGWKLSSRELYRILHALPRGTFGRTFLVQDFMLPIDMASRFLTFASHQVGVYPLWLCPTLGTETPQLLSPHYREKRGAIAPGDFDLINIGVYGIPADHRSIAEVTVELEDLAYTLGGRKLLYAVNYQTERQFWSRYDRKAYEDLRMRYRATGQWMDTYERTHNRR